MTNNTSWRLEPGDLLISPPKIIDKRFNDTVLMLTHLSDESSMALCLNRRTDQMLSKVLAPLNLEFNWDEPLYWGGPVSPTTVWMLHDSRWDYGATLNISDHWSISSSEAMFHELASGNLPSCYRFFFGFCSWTGSQLQNELLGEPPWSHRHSWLIVNEPDQDWVIETDAGELYNQSLQLCGSQAVEHWL